MNNPLNTSQPVIADVLLAVNARDADAAISRDPRMAGWRVVTRESQLFGLWIGEWAITERAAEGMRDYPKMVRYLRSRARWTEQYRANGGVR